MWSLFPRRIGLPSCLTASEGCRVAALGTAACAATLLLYLYPILCPLILYDDFQVLQASWTGPSTRANVWLPQNEHAMPLGRLSTRLLVLLAGRLTALPRLTALQGPLALIAGSWLVYAFVRREIGPSYYGLLAMAFFGVSAVYQNAVTWFAASFAVLALDTLLLALLAAQRWRQTGRPLYLALCVLGAALAPGWFAQGILAGPLCTLYLLPQEAAGRAAWRRRLLALTPLLGTAAFLAVSLPHTAEHIQRHLREDGRSAMGPRVLIIGANATARSVIDNLLPGVIGIPGYLYPVAVVVCAWAVLVPAAFRWWRRAPHRPFLALGLGLIFLSYLLVYSGRAHVSYEENMTGVVWSRYHLWPQLGLVLFVSGGLPLRPYSPLSGLSRRACRTVGVLIVVLFLMQLPRTPLGFISPDPEQGQVLQAIEDMDARCREHHVAADTARQALGPLPVPGGGEHTNGWDFLRGSPEPRPLTVAEARRLLRPEH
jgi:hypothetical protein